MTSDRVSDEWLESQIKAHASVGGDNYAALQELRDLRSEVEKANREPKHYVGNTWFVGPFVVTFEDGKLEWRRQHTFKLCRMTGVAEHDD